MLESVSKHLRVRQNVEQTCACTNMDAAAAAAVSAVPTVRAINSYQGDSHDNPDVSLPGLLANDKSVRRAYLPLLLHTENQ